MTTSIHAAVGRLRAAAVVGAAGLALLAAACDEGEAAVDEADAAGAAPDVRRVINVEVQPLQRQRFVDVIQITGTVVADRTVTVAAEQGGTVAQILADKGQTVAAGQALVRLDDELLRAQRDEAQAQARLAAELWDRARPLYEDEGIGTESAYLQARYTAESARARLAQIEERLARATVRAPFAGVLDARFVEAGTVVAPGTPVATLLDLDPLQIAAGVPERYAADVAVGSRGLVIFPSLGDTSAARVSYVGAAVHPGNRTFPIELDLDVPAGAVKPQMVADVVLERQILPDVIVVPRQSLVRTEDGFTAFVIDGTGQDLTARARAVRLGPSGRDEVVITAGLDSTDRLVVVGQQQVAAGDRVRIVNEP